MHVTNVRSTPIVQEFVQKGRLLVAYISPEPAFGKASNFCRCRARVSSSRCRLNVTLGNPDQEKGEKNGVQKDRLTF